MCIIAAQPVGTYISKETLKNCWENNRNGGGFCYTDGSKIIVFKELNSFNKYYAAFIEAQKANPESAFIHHFRISTHGKIDKTNCHPFLVSDTLAFAHNGIISNAPLHTDFSDTFMFNKVILKQLQPDFLTNATIVSLIEGYIGKGSKLAFLDIYNTITLINEGAGVWDAGVWYSNTGYMYSRYYDVGGVSTYFNSNPIYKKPVQKQLPEKKKQVQIIVEGIEPNSKLKYKGKSYQKVDNIDWDKRLRKDKTLQNDILQSPEIILPKYGTDRCDTCEGKLHSNIEKIDKKCYYCKHSESDAWGY